MRNVWKFIFLLFERPDIVAIARADKRPEKLDRLDRGFTKHVRLIQQPVYRQRELLQILGFLGHREV